MLDEVTQDKVEKIAREILSLTRNKMLVYMRFLDMAVSRLELTSNSEVTKSASADGKVYAYNPEHILTAYRVEENQPVRNYMHSVLHCVFKHMFVNPSINREYWDVACDVAVESVINDLNLTCFATMSADRQIRFLEGFKSELTLPSAEKVYRFLIDKHLPESTFNALKVLFKGDDHVLWYMSNEEKANLGLPGYGGGSGSGNGDDDGDGEGDGEGSGLGLFGSALAEDWGNIAERMAVDLATFGKQQGNGAGLLTQNLKEVTRERYDYTEFLKKFAVRGEVMKINPDEFDYNFYTYGLHLYENMPLIEPLEYKEVKRIRDFAIVIDTSGSVSGKLVQTFIQKTYNILKSTESFFSKINLHIIQCDAAIQEDIKITTQQEFDEYLKNMKLRGFGGTDFRPAFSYVNSLVDSGEFENLKGLIYFTDGFGDFPSKKPPYDAAFVFIEQNYNNYEVPSWAIKLVLREDEI